MAWGWVLVGMVVLGLGWPLWRRRAEDAAVPDAAALADQRTDTLTDYLTEAVLKVEPDGRISYANPAACRLLGYEGRELIGLGVEALVPEQQRHHHHHWRESFAASDRSRRMSELDALAARHKSGRAIPVRIQLTTLPDPDSERRTILATLYPAVENGVELDQLQSDARAGTWEWDLKRDRLSWSRGVYRMFGLDPQQFKASYEAYLQVVHPDDRARVDRCVNHSLQSGEPYEIEYRIIRDGDVRHLLERNYLNLDAEGVLHHMWGSVVDITEQRRAQDRLQLADAVFNHCAEGIIVFDSGQRVVRTNAALLEMTGFSDAGVLASGAEQLLATARSRPVSLTALLQQSDEWRGELNLICQCGEWIPVLASVSSIQTNGAAPRYVLVCSDIRILKAQEQQLRHQAMHDSLTGLPNRRLLAEQLERELARCQRLGQRLAVVYVDLDGFKAVNDRYGHEAGDELLCLLGAQLKGLIRASDFLARIGGDEFALILPDCGCDPQLNTLLARLTRDGACQYRDLRVTLSVGAACYPEQGGNGTELLLLADKAMYQAKRGGKNHSRIAGNS